MPPLLQPPPFPLAGPVALPRRAVGGAGLVLVWVASLFGQFTWHRGNGHIVGFTTGAAGVTMNKYGWGSQFKRGWTIKRTPIDQARWLPQVHTASSRQWWVWVPLWVPAAAAR